ncbi:MAG: 10 kDa chaperonin [bacterium ADurb.Bin157]|jgi:chaperonin GroES|nr:co-chaperone GroES [Candidatus Riflebacteria bacterium]NCB46378.1 co-chaperone GroES [bacterium]OQB45756.1 MAG: 10 kDa chaperonin [bacterium ADurb.Bin157]MDD2623920.1 co-chaperone GroES [Candidatus Riflebacteria bacterium]MDD3376972.1 co-chaperone GroES [Candidatus Riflebacteria bacterium]
MNLKPLNDRVIVKPQEAVEMSKGGIILPDTASKEKPMEGIVTAVGPGKMSKDGKRMALEVKNNDRVIFSKYAGTEIKVDGETYLIMREEDVLAIIAE